MIITKKIELRVDTKDNELKAKVWAYLRQLTRDICAAANKTISHRYFMEEAIDKLIKPDLDAIEKFESELTQLRMAYETPNLNKQDKKDLEEKIAKVQKQLQKLNSLARQKARDEFGKLSVAGEDGKEDGITLGGLTYRFLKVAELPQTIGDALSQKVNQDFENDQKDVTLGKRSLRSYKSEIIYFRLGAIKNLNEEGFEWLKLPNGEKIKFSFVYGSDKSAKHGYSLREFIQKCLAGTNKIADGQNFKIKDKKIFWNMAVDIPQIQPEFFLDPKKSIGVHISFLMPIAMATVDGQLVKQLGDNQDFMDRRYAFEDRQRRIQKRLKMVASGTGRQKIDKVLEKFHQSERNFVGTYNFTLAKEVVKFALKNGCGLIKIVNLSNVSNLVSESEVLRYWSYYDLHTKICSKAKQYGIEVKKVSPINIYEVFTEEVRDSNETKPESELELVGKFLSQKIEKINYNYVKRIANSLEFTK